MGFDWKEYLNLALFLEGQSGTGFAQEAAFRSSVSRAYYAAFCFARNYARDRHRFSATGTSRDHGLVRDHFRNRKMPEIARRLDNLRQWRNSCDYEDTVSNISLLVTSAIKEAREIIVNLP